MTVWVWDVNWAGTSPSAPRRRLVNTVWPTVQRYQVVHCSLDVDIIIRVHIPEHRFINDDYSN